MITIMIIIILLLLLIIIFISARREFPVAQAQPSLSVGPPGGSPTWPRTITTNHMTNVIVTVINYY